MSAFKKLLTGEYTEAEAIRNFGVVPTPETIQRIYNKLSSFGPFGDQGFDMAVRTYAIMRGDDEHLRFHKNVNRVEEDEEGNQIIAGELEEFLYPFNFPTPSTDECYKLKLVDSYTYGLNILSRTLDVELLDYEATDNLRVLAKDHTSGNFLIAKVAHEIPDLEIEFGYEEMPGNIRSIAGYLVLPKPEAIAIVAKSAISQLP